MSEQILGPVEVPKAAGWSRFGGAATILAGLQQNVQQPTTPAPEGGEHTSGAERGENALAVKFQHVTVPEGERIVSVTLWAWIRASVPAHELEWRNIEREPIEHGQKVRTPERTGAWFNIPQGALTAAETNAIEVEFQGINSAIGETVRRVYVLVVYGPAVTPLPPSPTSSIGSYGGGKLTAREEEYGRALRLSEGEPPLDALKLVAATAAVLVAAYVLWYVLTLAAVKRVVTRPRRT